MRAKVFWNYTWAWGKTGTGGKEQVHAKPSFPHPGLRVLDSRLRGNDVSNELRSPGLFHNKKNSGNSPKFPELFLSFEIRSPHLRLFLRLTRRVLLRLLLRVHHPIVFFQLSFSVEGPTTVATFILTTSGFLLFLFVLSHGNSPPFIHSDVLDLSGLYLRRLIFSGLVET